MVPVLIRLAMVPVFRIPPREPTPNPPVTVPLFISVVVNKLETTPAPEEPAVVMVPLLIN